MKSQECLEEAGKTPGHGQRGCLVLFSGGLDSILACKVLQEQGIRVTALKFITPFFGYEVKGREDEFCEKIHNKYGIHLKVIDITQDYLPMLRKPPHGHGKHFNPCIDCKILMIKKALGLLNELDAHFIATGEVIGQRPMSQRKDTLNCITNESGADGLLLRPLSARSLKPTIPELEGWIDPELLPHISGRGRKLQFELAEKFGIKDFPSPAGGCVLADPIQGQRLKKYFAMWEEMDANDCCLALTGRQFLLPGGGWFVMGRDREENMTISSLKRDGDLFLRSMEAPAPSGILRFKAYQSHDRGEDADPASDIRLAASLMLFYCRKCNGFLKASVRGRGTDMVVEVSDTPDREMVRSLSPDLLP